MKADSAFTIVLPDPACHLVHSWAVATAALVREHNLKPYDVVGIRARLAADSMDLVCQPLEKKRRPSSGYDAQFSVPYTIASVLVRGQLTLAELEPEVFTAPEILAQCDKVTCEADPESAYPKYFSGEASCPASQIDPHLPLFHSLQLLHFH